MKEKKMCVMYEA